MVEMKKEAVPMPVPIVAVENDSVETVAAPEKRQSAE